jgi:hypothetical protein
MTKERDAVPIFYKYEVSQALSQNRQSILSAEPRVHVRFVLGHLRFFTVNRHSTTAPYSSIAAP